MKITDTISVNPGKTTLGHVDTPASSIFRSPVLGAERDTRTVDLLKLVFPATRAGLSEYRKYELPLRTIFSTILIVTGLSLLTTSFGIHGAGFAIATLCFGGTLALGLCTRPVMLGAAVFYCICGALSLRAGTPDITIFSLMFGCLIFSVTGGGKYSCDMLIRRTIYRHKINAQRKRMEDSLGYKAFHSVKY